MNNNDNVFASINDDLDKYVSNILKNLAAVTRDELANETINSIEEFYRDYTPKYYKRHYYNFLKNSWDKYYQNNRNKIYSGGVVLSTENMDDIYQGDLDEVFDMVYAGFHGVSSGFNSPKTFSVTPVMKPSPIQIINSKKDYIIKNIGRYVKDAKQKAMKDNYYYIF